MIGLLLSLCAFASTSADAIEADLKRWDTQICLLYTSPSPRDERQSRMPSSA